MKPRPLVRQMPFLRILMPVLRNLHGNARRRAIGIAKHRREAGDRQMFLLREHQARHRRRIAIVAQCHARAVHAVEMLLRIKGAARIAQRLLRQR